VRGWIRWQKATGTGNTGWIAGAEADTGWRDITSTFTVTAGVTIDVFHVRRVGAAVYIRVKATNTTGSARMDAVTGVLPTGFRVGEEVYVGLFGTDSVTVVQKEITIYTSSGAVRLQHFDNQSGVAWHQGTFLTKDSAWPSSLPGTAA